MSEMKPSAEERFDASLMSWRISNRPRLTIGDVRAVAIELMCQTHADGLAAGRAEIQTRIDESPVAWSLGGKVELGFYCPDEVGPWRKVHLVPVDPKEEV